MLPYLGVIVSDFYLLPLLIKDTGSAIVVLLILVPFVCFACSLVYGARHSFHWSYAAMVAVLFTPTIFIFYNSSAWVYIIGYGVVALMGNLIGTTIKKVK